MKKVILLAVCAAVIGCTGSNMSLVKSDSPTGSLYIKASVLRVDGDTATLRTLPMPENIGRDSSIAVLTSKILNLTYLTEGSRTTINGKSVTVTEKRGDTLMIIPSAGLKAGDQAELFIPKKTLIISDLKVTDNSKNMVGKLAFGEFSEKLTNSGRFTVLERKELSAILQEHALELNGMTDPEQASLLGKILKADLMLSGEMLKSGFNCVFDIRVIDTATSKILGVARENTLCSKVEDTRNIRSTAADYGNFETSETKGWILGDIKNFKGRTVLDTTTGAGGTSSSILLMVNNREMTDTSAILNKIKRDLSGFTQVHFWAKADRSMTGVFFVDDEDEDGNTEYFDRWAGTFWLNTEWKEYTLNLDELTLSKGMKKESKMNQGDKRFSPDMVKLSGFIFPKHKNKEITNAKVWVDELSFH
ncbi:MAG: CsgG/HfaB family protein [Deferribacterales bacterium]